MPPTPKPLYYLVYDWMISELHLKGGAERDVYALLYSLADNTGVARVSLQYVIERVGYSDKSVRMAIQSLCKNGWMKKSRQDHYGINEYEIFEPAGIIGRFNKSRITAVKTTAENDKTQVKTTAEQRQNLPLILEETTADTPYIYNFYNKIYNNFFITDLQSEKKEKEILLEEFFIRFGLYQPMSEVIRFWEYHEQTGWKNGKGQKIVNKKSAAAFWTVSDESAHKKMSDLAFDILSRLVSVLSSEERKCIIAETKCVERQENTLYMFFETEKPVEIIENDKNLPKFAKIVRSICGNEISVEYKVELNNNLKYQSL